MGEGPICPCYSLWDADHTLTEAQKKFLGSMVIVGFGGIFFSWGLVALGVPPHSHSSEYSTIYKIAGGGVLLSVAELCCVKPLKHIFRKLNQRQNVTAPTESSPILDEV
ncbi:MAG: hypothetical protein ACRCU0_03500 [Candidatus Rhabdochlamydia sp.]